MTIIIPLVTGTIDDGAGGTTCIEANEADLVVLGATLSDCTPAPDQTDSTEGPEETSDLDDPWGDLPDTNADLCTGGGTFGWAQVAKITATGSCYKDKRASGLATTPRLRWSRSLLSRPRAR